MSSSLLRDIIAAVLAAGAVIAVLSAAAGWYLRGRVREPTE